jgi:hypothetical protein
MTVKWFCFVREGFTTRVLLVDGADMVAVRIWKVGAVIVNGVMLLVCA